MDAPVLIVGLEFLAELYQFGPSGRWLFGIEADRLALDWGRRLEIGIADEILILVR
mgnify:CR=1 FL=1